MHDRRRAPTTCSRALQGDPRAVAGDHRAASAAPMGCIVYDGPITDDLEDGIVGKGFPIEVYNVLGAGDAFMSGFLRGWLSGETARDLLRPGPMPAAPSRCRGCSARRNIRPSTELQYLPEERQPAPGAAQGRGRSTTSTGRRRAAASPDTLMALAIDHRMQLEAMAQRGRRAASSASRDFKVLAVEAAARVADGRARLRHADRRATTAARRCSEPPTIRSGSAGRSSCRARARCDFEFAQDIGSQLVEWPVDHTHQVPVLLPSRRSGRAEGASRSAKLLRAVRRRAQGRPRAAGRDHRRQARPARRRHRRRARCSELYDARHQAGLVEARAAARPQPPGRRSTR